jgi:hypothetical protein
VIGPPPLSSDPAVGDPAAGLDLSKPADAERALMITLDTLTGFFAYPYTPRTDPRHMSEAERLERYAGALARTLRPSVFAANPDPVGAFRATIVPDGLVSDLPIVGVVAASAARRDAVTRVLTCAEPPWAGLRVRYVYMAHSGWWAVYPGEYMRAPIEAAGHTVSVIEDANHFVSTESCTRARSVLTWRVRQLHWEDPDRFLKVTASLF